MIALPMAALNVIPRQGEAIYIKIVLHFGRYGCVPRMEMFAMTYKDFDTSMTRCPVSEGRKLGSLPLSDPLAK